VRSLANSMICGAVAISSHCGAIKPWSAFIIGAIAGLLYCVMCFIMKVSY